MCLCPGPASARLEPVALASPPTDDRAESPREDLEVEPERSVLDVEQVVLELARHVLGRARVAALDLRPTGQPWLDEQPRPEMRNRGFQVALELGPLRPRSDEAHIAAHDVQELRKLIQARRPQEASYTSDARVAARSELRSRGFSIRGHRPQLEELEHASVLSNASLDEENGTA